MHNDVSVVMASGGKALEFSLLCGGNTAFPAYHTSR